MTRHIAPASLTVANPTIYLHCALTHRVIASRSASAFTWGDDRRWQWIASRIAEECDCNEDEVHAVDTERRMDCIEVNGRVVAYIDEN